MLFDTDVIIWAFRGSAKAAREIEHASPRVISAVTYMELLQGARNKREQNLIRHFLNSTGFIVLPITETISHRAMNFIEEFALQSGLQLADALVFATACESSLCLCSSNEKHFRSISALESRRFVP